MNPDLSPSSPCGVKGRLLVWPDICPVGLDPPWPCHYLTWPAWESYRQAELGQEAEPRNLLPLEVHDPPAFRASLSALLGSSGYREIPNTLASLSLPNSPFQDEESAYSLAMSMRGDPGSPYAHALRGKRRETPAAEPAYLILALWSRARSLARQAEDLFNGALALQKGMMGELTGESDTHGLENFGVGPTDGPPAMRGVFAAWLKLAGPLLTEDDRLWAPLGPNRELAAMSLASASSVKARLWPENGENG